MPPVNGEALRALMRRVASPVTVVTAADGETARGVTIGSFTSVSLDPPLVSFNLMQEGSMAPVLRETAEFAVHVLSDEQAHLSNHFAVPDQSPDAQWAEVDHTTTAAGTPLLPDVVGTLLCRPFAMHEVGDHFLVVGEVVDVLQEGDVGPLLYHGRTYHALGDEVSALSLLNAASTESGSP